MSAQAQEYRLSLDNFSVPELYHTSTIFLEKKEGDSYKLIKRGYRLTTNDGRLKGNELSYDPAVAAATGGVINFMAIVDGKEIPLSLKVPVLQDIRFNLYTDSIKPILNYYVNVEGVYSSGKIYPLTTDQVIISSDQGTMSGNEWIVPKSRTFEKVMFTATSRIDPRIKKSVTLYLKKYNDPRDAEGYEDRSEEDIRRGRNR
jgi:hypothetical protein